MINSIANKYLLGFYGNKKTCKTDIECNNKKNQNIGSNRCGFTNSKKMTFAGCYPKYEDWRTGIQVIPVFGHIDVQQFSEMMISSILSSGKNIAQIFGSMLVPNLDRINFNGFAKIISEFVNSGKILGKGESGYVFSLDDNHVLKIFRKEKEHNGERERKVWDSFYEDGIDVSGLPYARTAFKIPGGNYLLISKKIDGSKPTEKNKFNEKNLRDLIRQICELDSPEIFIDGDNNLFYGVRMHNDLHRNNVNITNKKAGILDFEFLRYEFSNLKVLENIPNLKDLNNIFSDNGILPSNLKTFELRSFVPYLFDLYSAERNPAEIRNILEKYLKLKAEYHKVMSSNLRLRSHTLNPNIFITNIRDFFKLRFDLIQSEYAHFKALHDNNPYVVTAEAIKMQLCHFMRIMSPVCKDDSAKINLEQVKSYIENAEKFFTAMKKSSLRGTQYWDDCIKFVENCKKLYEAVQFLNIPVDIDRITVLQGLPVKRRTMSIEEIENIVSQEFLNESDVIVKVHYLPQNQSDFYLTMSLNKLYLKIYQQEMLKSKATDQRTLTLTQILGLPKGFKDLGM